MGFNSNSSAVSNSQDSLANKIQTLVSIDNIAKHIKQHAAEKARSPSVPRTHTNSRNRITTGGFKVPVTSQFDKFNASVSGGVPYMPPVQKAQLNSVLTM